MKFIIKIFLGMLILLLGYGILIFLAPELTAKIDSVLGVQGFSEKIRTGKDMYDSTITSDIPSLQEFQSGATQVRDTVLNGAQETKEKIDTIRSSAEKIEQTVKQGKQTYEDAKEVLQDTNQKIQEIQGIVEEVQNITGTGSK